MIALVERFVPRGWSLPSTAYLDKPLLLSVLALISLGLVMVFSASVGFADYGYKDGFYFLKRHAAYLCISLCVALPLLWVPLHLWYRHAGLALLGSIVLLVAVLLPGIGHEVNGSSRWLRAGPLTVQVSELAKVAVVIFIAAYLQRRHLMLREQWQDFAKPLAIMGLVAVLLLLEPDFGSTMVIGATVMAMLFLAGVRLGQFLALVVLGIAGVLVLIVTSPYRFERMTGFLDPWADQ